MDMRNHTRHIVQTHARVNFSQSETSLLLFGEGGGVVKFSLLLVGVVGGVNKKDPLFSLFLEELEEPSNFRVNDKDGDGITLQWAKPPSHMSFAVPPTYILDIKVNSC